MTDNIKVSEIINYSWSGTKRAQWIYEIFYMTYTVKNQNRQSTVFFFFFFFRTHDPRGTSWATDTSDSPLLLSTVPIVRQSYSLCQCTSAPVRDVVRSSWRSSIRLISFYHSPTLTSSTVADLPFCRCVQTLSTSSALLWGPLWCIVFLLFLWHFCQ